jgi:N-glycosylase/DNA lyase
MVHSAASSFSPPLLSDGATSFHPFPPPSAFLAADTESRLRALGFGYRAAFIHRTALALCEAQPTDPEGWLQEVVREWPDEDRAREALMAFVGVGRKVADCVLLMSGGDRRKHIVPVDVHVLVRLMGGVRLPVDDD